MTFWITPKGEKLTLKEFFSRWKKGIQKVTLENQVTSQILFTWIMIIGFCIGFFISLFFYKNLWWVCIVLFGAIGNSIIQLITLYQKRKTFEYFKNFEDVLKGGNENEQERTI